LEILKIDRKLNLRLHRKSELSPFHKQYHLKMAGTRAKTGKIKTDQN